MPLRTCEYNHCEQVAARDIGSCGICSLHLCAKHARKPLHACPDMDVHAEQEAFDIASIAAYTTHFAHFISQINFSALTDLASSLRNEIPCSLPALARDDNGELDYDALSSQRGGQNCNLDVQFEDGVVWIARIRLNDAHLPPKATQAYISLSEVTNLRYLEQTGLPIPKVFHFAPETNDNSVGVPFMLMEKMKGQPRVFNDWESMTAGQKTKILHQLVDIYLQLEKYPSTSMGSLIPTKDGASIVGAFARGALFSSPNTSLGPFNSLELSLRAMLEHQKQLITSGERASLPVDQYLSILWAEDMLPRILAFNGTDSEFYLKHNDDKGDHILVDEEYNITAILDWEFASFEPKSLAFSSPCMLWPVGDFFDGKNNLSPCELELATIYKDRGRNDLADIVRNGRKMQRLSYLHDGGAPQIFDEFEAMFQATRDVWAEPNEVVNPYAEWKEEVLKRYVGDLGLQRLLISQNVVV